MDHSLYLVIRCVIHLFSIMYGDTHKCVATCHCGMSHAHSCSKERSDDSSPSISAPRTRLPYRFALSRTCLRTPNLSKDEIKKLEQRRSAYLLLPDGKGFLSKLTLQLQGSKLLFFSTNLPLHLLIHPLSNTFPKTPSACRKQISFPSTNPHLTKNAQRRRRPGGAQSCHSRIERSKDYKATVILWRRGSGQQA